jgi:ABC-type antimicrobial peptide transport system permease subunit
VRSAGPAPLSLVRSVSEALGRAEPHAALSFHTLERQVQESLTQERLVATLSGFFGGLALLLAGIGLYGVTSYTVNTRRREIGVRMALGATRSIVVRTVLTQVAFLVGAGVAIGAGFSVWASTFVSALLYGLGPRDTATLVAAAALLAAVGAVAGWLPARRAASIDPMAALREG